MATKSQYRFRFRSSPQAVSDRFSEPGYYPSKHRLIGAWDIVEQAAPGAPTDGSLCVRYMMKVSAAVPLPDSLRKLLGGTLAVTQTDRWDAARRGGAIEIEVKGLPIRASASTRLEATGDEVDMVSDWTVSCGVPLVGGIVERLVAQDIESRQRKECAAFA